MQKFTILATALLAMSCNNKSDDKAILAPKAIEPQPKAAEPPAPNTAATAAMVSVTSKSPDAIKAFEHGRALIENSRGSEAFEALNKAIELDPDFAQAHAYLGSLLPGADGVAELAKAASLAAKLPEAERLVIEAMQALATHDDARRVTAYTRAAVLAPGEWRTFASLGDNAAANGDPTGAIAWYEKAVPGAPALAQNGLAYAHATLRHWDLAIAAARKQAELLPKEPNAQDTLAEILLKAGKFDDSEHVFQVGLTLDPHYGWFGWQGIACARAYRGDWKGAVDANDKQLQSVDVANARSAAGERIGAQVEGAWLALAAGKLPDAIAKLDAIEQGADVKTAHDWWGVYNRGAILQMAGKLDESDKAFATFLTRAQGFPDSDQKLVAVWHALAVLRNAMLAGKAAPDAAQLVATVDGDATTKGTAAARGNAAWAHGLVAWSKGGPKEALAELGKCPTSMLACRADLATAQRKAGDPTGADATEKQIRETPQRDGATIYLVTHLAKT